jgi:glycosyltransferase involved in cell wall biosynthesis
LQLLISSSSLTVNIFITSLAKILNLIKSICVYLHLSAVKNPKLAFLQEVYSASGVLNRVVGYCKPCLASVGEGSLRSVVQNYELGIWVDPDDVNGPVKGVIKWLENPSNPQWERYFEEISWLLNANSVIKCLVKS